MISQPKLFRLRTSLLPGLVCGCLALAVAHDARAALVGTGAPSPIGEGQWSIPLVIQVFPGEEVAGLQTDLLMPPGYRLVSFQGGASASSAGKQVIADEIIPGQVRVLAAGLNRAIMSSGLVARIIVSNDSDSAPPSIAIAGVVFASPDGDSVDVGEPPLEEGEPDPETAPDPAEGEDDTNNTDTDTNTDDDSDAGTDSDTSADTDTTDDATEDTTDDTASDSSEQTTSSGGRTGGTVPDELLPLLGGGVAGGGFAGGFGGGGSGFLRSDDGRGDSSNRSNGSNRTFTGGVGSFGGRNTPAGPGPAPSNYNPQPSFRPPPAVNSQQARKSTPTSGGTLRTSPTQPSVPRRQPVPADAQQRVELPAREPLPQTLRSGAPPPGPRDLSDYARLESRGGYVPSEDPVLAGVVTYRDDGSRGISWSVWAILALLAGGGVAALGLRKRWMRGR